MSSLQLSQVYILVYILRNKITLLCQKIDAVSKRQIYFTSKLYNMILILFLHVLSKLTIFVLHDSMHVWFSEIMLMKICMHVYQLKAWKENVSIDYFLNVSIMMDVSTSDKNKNISCYAFKIHYHWFRMLLHFMCV